MHYNRFKTFKMLNFTDQTLFQVHVGLVNALSIVAHIVRNTFGESQHHPKCFRNCACLAASDTGVNVHIYTLNSTWRCERSHFSSLLSTFNSIYLGENVHTLFPIYLHSTINAPSTNKYSTDLEFLDKFKHLLEDMNLSFHH